MTKYLYTQGFKDVSQDLEDAKCFVKRCISRKAPVSVFPTDTKKFSKDNAAALAHLVKSARQVGGCGVSFLCYA